MLRSVNESAHLVCLHIALEFRDSAVGAHPQLEGIHSILAACIA